MKAEVITVGDELLRGEIVDSNKSLLSERLLALDIETRWHTSVGDDPADMTDAFRRAAERSRVVLVSGGLGPTRDDLTSAVLAQAFGREHRLDPAVLETIRAFFRNVGREMAENNARQAWFPEGAEVLPNPIGTAPGFLLEQGRALFFCMPGVPREMERMLREQVLPRIAARRGGGPVVRAALLRTFGIGESSLDDELKDIAASGDVTLGFYKGNVLIQSRTSPNSLYDADVASMEAGGSYNQDDAEGFLRIMGLPGRVQGRVHPRAY